MKKRALLLSMALGISAMLAGPAPAWSDVDLTFRFNDTEEKEMRAALDQFHQVARVGLIGLVMHVADRLAADGLPVLRVLEGSLDLDATGLVHLVAGNHTNHPLMHALTSNITARSMRPKTCSSMGPLPPDRD